MNFKKYLFTIGVFLVLFSATNIKAANVGDVVDFNIDQNFDASARAQLSATLVKTTSGLYFYVEKNWWDLQNTTKQNEILNNFDNLSAEFDNNIYPTLTSLFGFESKPGVDKDNKITILFHSMEEGAAGYFRSTDGYIKLQLPTSNEREMIYISLLSINDPQLKIFVGHEFTHLITFNQKDKIRGVSEEIWLNEARADFSSTILGYDKIYKGSNLQRRVKDFLNSSSDSLTEWQEIKFDYAVANLFMHYLADHYGMTILTDSLKSKLVGISSINEALLKTGAKENFAQIFTNWTIATTINDCSVNPKYCYLNKNLKNLRINPTLNFLPLIGDSSLSVTNVTKNWSGNWQKIIGGNGDLKLEFLSSANLNFQVPYILYDKNNNYLVDFLKFNKNPSAGSGQVIKGEINIKNFGAQYNSLIIIPSLQTKNFGFYGFESAYPYTFTVSITGAVIQEDSALIQKLLAQIESLKKQIADLSAVSGQTPVACVVLNSNLYFGLMSNANVGCLQQFLKNQGAGIYPEALVTGNFGSLTRSAVMRFQKLYGINQTGFVGILTRAKINELLK